MKRGMAIVLLMCLAGAWYGFGQEDSARLDALKKYILEKDYPEVFKDSPYKTRIEGLVDADVDNDGTKEIVVLFYPHYRQSAPILIYKVSPDLKVIKRVTEGLAPGPLQRTSGDYLDPHQMGMAVDFETPSQKASPEQLLRIVGGSGMSGLVLYDTFNHIDGRTGAPYFIDMRGAKIPSKMHDCSEFEFSRVRQIAVGGLLENPEKNYLAAWVGNEIYVYLIQGESSDGLLNKKQWIIKAPTDFNGFDSAGSLAYKTAGGSTVLSLK